jgi:tripartite-type tricarboxylate transporter receptor subunit TctC
MSVAGRRKSKVLLPLLVVALVAAAAAAARAQADFPNRPIRVVVPLAPGGTADLLPRLVGEKLTLRWGQPVIIENKPGGALHLGAEAVARSAPDGYTLLLAPQGPLVLSPSLYSKLSYDPSAFVPVTILARLPYVFVANPKVPASTVPELIAFAKANPDKLNFGTPGTGSAQHLAVEWFKLLAGVRLTHVPYRGAAPAVADMLAGHVPQMFDKTANTIPKIRQGKIQTLAISRCAAAHPGASRRAGDGGVLSGLRGIELVQPGGAAEDAAGCRHQAVASDRRGAAHARRREAPARAWRYAGRRSAG